MAKFTKLDLIASLGLHDDIESKAAATRIVDTLFTTLKEQIVEGNEVVIPLIGTASVVERAARSGHNPQNGEPLNIPAKNVVKIKVTAPLKRAVI